MAVPSDSSAPGVRSPATGAVVDVDRPVNDPTAVETVSRIEGISRLVRGSEAETELELASDSLDSWEEMVFLQP